MEQAARTALQQLETSQLAWVNDKGNQETIALTDPRAKKLLKILAAVAEPSEEDDALDGKRKDDNETFYEELISVWVTEPTKETVDDTSAPKPVAEDTQVDRTPWLLEAVKATGFGGINGPNASEPFNVELRQGSTCFLGGNGTGKTSLISAIAWALTGQRVSDTSGLSDAANERHPIFDKDEPAKQVGTWPPVATYPADSLNTINDPETTVTLTFRKEGTDERAQVSRTWKDNVDGFTEVKWDNDLEPIRQCIDIAVEMPLRISHLRLGQRGHLNDAVASLTGLDVLTSIGELVAGIKRSNSRFRNTPKKDDHDAKRKTVETFFEMAETHLPSLIDELAPYKKIENWIDDSPTFDTELRAIAEQLNQTAGEDLSSLESYVDPSLDLSLPEMQIDVDNDVAAAIAAYDPINLGEFLRKSCPKLSAFRQCVKNIDDAVKGLTEAADNGFSQLEKVLELHRQKLIDKKLALKAAAAETHHRLHGDIPIENCTLCDREFDNKSLKELGSEIKNLLADAELLKKSLTSSCSEIVAKLNEKTKSTITLSVDEIAQKKDPIDLLGDELRNHFITSQVFTKTLPEFGTLFEARFDEAKKLLIPPFDDKEEALEAEIDDLPSDDQSTLRTVLDAIQATKRTITIVQWAPAGIQAIDTFCLNLLSPSPKKEPPSPPQKELSARVKTFADLCDLLDRATKQAKPSLLAAKELRRAADAAAIWLKDEKSRQIRAEISEAISPLSMLPNYVEAEVTRQLKDLSGRIASIAKKFHISAGLAFQRALVERAPHQRKGTLRARASQCRTPLNNGGEDNQFGYEFDVSLIANASWIRALLWAFLFALRESRAQYLGGLTLPLMLMDDPQLTFDFEHHCAWIQFVLDQQDSDGLSPPPQAIFTTYDKSFAHHLELLLSNFPIRHIIGPPEEGGSIFAEGMELIDRLWLEAERTKSNETASKAIGELRKHLESMMRVIFPPAMGASATTLGQLIYEFEGQLNQPKFPYDSQEFNLLVKSWKEPTKEKHRKALSEPHHNEQSPYNYDFGRELFAWFQKALYVRFRAAFLRIWRVREAGWNMPHSGMAAVSVIRSSDLTGTSFPLPANLNNVVARVAAESNGREVVVIDDQPSLKFVEEKGETDDLGQLQAWVLIDATLEPAALIGDVLLISSSLPPTPNSLVICHAEGAWRARRLSPLGGSETHAVLIANAVNPRQIRKSLLVEYENSLFRKIVGIVYKKEWEVPSLGDDELVPMKNMSGLNTLLARSEGLARIIGESAEPIALDGQYLMLEPPIKSRDDLNNHVGQPIVVDRNGRTLFKRLRLGNGNAPIVLESLDAAGRYPPVVISVEEAEQLGETLTFRPVIGVLFDSQSKRLSK